ncbi:MAG: glycosyltransferase family 39 protein [Gemmatimonadales bacterium]
MRSFLLVVAIAALLRFVLAGRQDLWADELFSLAVATGHSLEHPAAQAEPAAGDFVEPGGAVTPATFRYYLSPESSSVVVSRVIRAVRLSDTSPPLYYLVLAGWTRLFGTSDLTLHALSIAWALAAMPLLWLIGLRVGTPRDALTGCVLFALAPASLYYSVEARMYAMLWFETVLAAWLTLRLHDRGGTAALAAWTITGAAGLLTHYFFAFVWAACVLWLVLRPGHFGRLPVVAALVLNLALIAPWYRLVPDTMARWRVTGHWLDGLPSAGHLLLAPVALGWSFVSGRGVWGGLAWPDRGAALIVAGVGLLWLRRGRSALFAQGRDLLWLLAVASCVGPVVFDLLRGTSTSLIARYALAGMPAGLLLLALALGELPRRGAALALALLILTWLPGLREIAVRRSRAWEPYRAVAHQVGAWVGPRDLILVHSIPSGVLGIARYLTADVPIAAWVGQLGRRTVPSDIEALVASRSRVALIRIHDVGEPAPEEAWLRAHATVLREERREGADVVYFDVESTRR